MGGRDFGGGRVTGRDCPRTSCAVEATSPDSKPVSVDSRTGLCQRGQFLPGKGLARPETGPGFLAATPDSARQRLASPASLAPKPREVEDYSGGTAKPDLRGTAWWARQAHHHRAISKAYPHKHPLKPILVAKGICPPLQTRPRLFRFSGPRNRDNAFAQSSSQHGACYCLWRRRLAQSIGRP
jgi:hypothetical protein